MKENLKKHLNGYELLMAAVIIARSTSFVISKLSMRSLAPMNLLAVRFVLAFLILVALFFKKFGGMNLRVLRDGVLLGATYTAVMVFEMYGLRLTESATASFIENSAFLLVPVLEIIFLHEFPKPLTVAGMVLAFFGVALLTVAGGAKINSGCLFCMGAMAFYALAIFETSVFANESDPLLVGIVQIGTMGLLSLLLSLILETPRLPSSSAEWTMILLLAVVCSVFGFTLQPVAQKHIQVDRAGMFSALNPLAATFWGYLVLDERITWIKAVGAVFILAGIVIPVLKNRRNKLI